MSIPEYSINFLPQKLAEKDFYIWVTSLIDWALQATTDDEFLEIPTEFIDLLDTYDSEEAVLAYYNSTVKPAIGTAWLMDILLKLFNSPFTMEEWFEYSGDSFKFKILAYITPSSSFTDFSAAEKVKLTNLIREFANERSILEGLVFDITLTDSVATDVTVVDTSLDGNTLVYEQYDGDDGGGAGTLVYDGSATYGAKTTTPWS